MIIKIIIIGSEINLSEYVIVGTIKSRQVPGSKGTLIVNGSNPESLLALSTSNLTTNSCQTDLGVGLEVIVYSTLCII